MKAVRGTQGAKNRRMLVMREEGEGGASADSEVGAILGVPDVGLGSASFLGFLMAIA